MSMAAPSGPWLPTVVTVTASWLAGVPTVILSPTAKPSARRTLIRLAPDGTRTVVASAGLVDPTGLAVGGGSIYISNYGVFPGAGPGRYGEVVSFPAP